MIRQVYMAMVTVLMVVFANENVILEVVLYEHQDNGEYNTHTYKLTGRFSRAGTTISAEGDIVQIHPLALCDATDDDGLYQYGWVGVIKLEEPRSNPEPCLSVYQKAKRAIQRGATAVVFDVTDNPSASHQLHNTKLPSLERPVIIIKGSNALKLMEIVRTETVARARIVYQKKTPKPGQDESTTKEYFDMGIFLAFFVLFCVVCIIIIVKLKWSRRRRDTTPSTSDQTKQIVSKLQIRKFKVVASNMSGAGGWRPPSNTCSRSGSRSTSSLNSNNCEGCAICLEVYIDGQDLRLIPCGHEFHKVCVDPWLLSNHTCPLCMYDILETCKDVSHPATQNARTSQSGNNTIVPVLMPHHSTTISNNYVDFPVTSAHQLQPPNASASSRQTRGQTTVYNEGYHAAAERSSNYANYFDYVSLAGRPRGLLGSGVVSCAHSSGEEYCQIQSPHRTHGTGYRDSNDGHCSDRTRRYRKHYAKTQYADGREHRRTANGRESGHPVQWRTEHHTRLSYRNPRLVVMKSYKDFYSPCTSSESDHECVKRSAKVSVARSHTQEEHTDSNHNQTDISNESIYGSSDTAPSDISSCTSNVYCSSQVDNSKRPDGQMDLPPVRLRPSCTMQRCSSPYCAHARRSTSRRRVSCSSCSSLEVWLTKSGRLQDDRTDTSRDSVCTVSSGDLSISSVLSCVTEEMDTDRSHKSRAKHCACARRSEGTRALPAGRQTPRHVCEHSTDKMGQTWNATLCTASHRHDQPRTRAASCQCSRCDNIALMHERLTQASYNMRLLPWLCPPPPVHPLLLPVYDTHCPANSPGTSRRCSAKDAQCVQCECGHGSMSPQLVNTSDNESIQSKRSMVLYSENIGNTQTVPMDKGEEYDPENVV